MELNRPAIEGGKPVRANTLPYARQSLDDGDLDAVAGALKSGWITSGPRVEEFEKAVALKAGAPQAVAVTSCTAALQLALNALGIGPGHEVITTPLTFAATPLSAIYNGAMPVLVDIDERDLNINPDLIEERITSRTRAIMPVHYGGAPVGMDKILDIAQRHGLMVVEDAAHAIGAKYNGRPIGVHGHAVCFSFHAVKNITTAEGGAIATADADLSGRLRSRRFFGIPADAWQRAASPKPWEYDVFELGFKCNMTDIQAALGISQLKRLDSFLTRRREIVGRYDLEFSQMEELILNETMPGAESAHHLYVVRIRPERFKVGRDSLLAALRAEGINANIHYKPVHMHTFFIRHLGDLRGRFPVCERAAETLITLPLFPAMTDGDVSDVITAVKKLVEWYRA